MPGDINFLGCKRRKKSFMEARLRGCLLLSALCEIFGCLFEETGSFFSISVEAVWSVNYIKCSERGSVGVKIFPMGLFHET